MLSGITLRRLSIAALPLAVACWSSNASGQTATLKGKFVLDGTAAAPATIKVTKDAEVCGKHKLVEEQLVVDKSGGIQNVFIYQVGPKDKLGGGKAPEALAVMDNVHCRFEPRALVMQAGQTLEVKNSDPAIGHNTEGHPKNNKEFNLSIPAGNSIKVPMPKGERLPFEVKCGIHPWMKGYVLVAESPRATVSGADGSFEIKDLPAGVPVEFQVWQERGGYVKDVTVDGKKATWLLGKFKKTLQPGVNDMGTIKAKIGG